MTILRTALAVTGLTLFSVSLQAGFITEAQAGGGTFGTSAARAQNGVLFGGSSENFTCGGGTSSAGGTAPTNSFASATCEFGREFASADLATGALRAFALTSGSSLGTVSVAIAMYSDTITFANSTGGDLLLGVSYVTRGTVAQGAGQTTADFSEFFLSKDGQSQQNITLQGSNNTPLADGLRFVYLNGSSSFHDPLAGGSPSLAGWTTSSVGGIGALVQGTLVVPSGVSIMDMFARLSVDCRIGADCDFSHTSAFSFDALPAGLSFTSSSGVFLTSAPTEATAPEPGTWAMLCGGLLCLGVLRRRNSDPA